MKIAIPIGDSKGGTQLGINKAYTNYIGSAGYEPILVTPYNDIEVMSDLCDGLLLPGGGDIDPIYYDEDNIASHNSEPDRDKFERELLHVFANKNKPIFGICRGMQLIIREFLLNNPEYYEYFQYYQHIPSHSLANELSIARTQPSHNVFVLRNYLYGEVDNTKTVKMYVNSMHHQAVYFSRKKNDRRLVIGDTIVCGLTRHGMGTKESDVIVEAIKILNWSTGGIHAVQWHPEELNDYALLHTLFGIPTEAGA